MFYPLLTRRKNYSSPHNNGGNFADYRKYADEIAEDCKNRCVYCDAKVSENLGGDSFQLDHFRPQKLFSHLKTAPTNLVLACPACNRLKSDQWPVPTTSSATFVRGQGFIDPFSVNRLDFFRINSDGTICAIKDPGNYIIRLLRLDRPARNNLRRRRILFQEISDLADLLKDVLEKKTDAFEREEISKSEFLEVTRSLKIFLENLGSMKNVLL